MRRLRDIMTTDLLTLSPDMNLREAMEELSRHHVSGAPVLSGGKLVGVVSTTDLLDFAATASGVPTERETSDAWDDASASLDEDEAPDEIASSFFVDMWDDAGADATSRATHADTPEWNVLEEHDVSEVMTRPPLVTMGPDEPVGAAALLMADKKIHRILVTEGSRLVGMVSALDVAREAATHPNEVRTYVFDRADDFR